MQTPQMNKRIGLNGQKGAVLIIALVMLLVLTVLGTASIRDTTMEERMAGNFRDLRAAFEAAEAALRTGEAQIANTTVYTAMLFDGTDGTYDVTPLSHSVRPDTAASWRTLDEDQLDKANTLLSADAQFYIEKLPPVDLFGSDVQMNAGTPQRTYFRITARGNGISPNSEVILQSTLFDWNGNP